MKTALEILVAAKARITAPADWAQGDFAQDSDGWSVVPTGRTACKWCSLGAVMCAAGQQTENIGPLHEAMNALNDAGRAMGYLGAASLNDSCSHSMALEMFDKAIAKVEKGTV
jgi:hypothetical protein